jgi:hypothetical protein
MVRLTPAHQILDRGSSATHSSHAANQRANISLIDRRSRWPRRVPYLARGSIYSPSVFRAQALLVFVDKESHINVRGHRADEMKETKRYAASEAPGGPRC